jgi:hypothetical protein
MLAISTEQRRVVGQPFLGPFPACCPDQGAAADRDAAIIGEPGADGALGEMRGWRGLLIPAGRREVVQQPGRVSIRYRGMPSRRTSTSPSPASASRMILSTR